MARATARRRTYGYLGRVRGRVRVRVGYLGRARDRVRVRVSRTYGY